MRPVKKVCSVTPQDHAARYVAFLKQRLHAERHYPPLRHYRFLVGLALYSKAITVAEATIALVRADFPEEAFGLSRTLLELQFTARYIANKDTEARAEQFYK